MNRNGQNLHLKTKMRHKTGILNSLYINFRRFAAVFSPSVQSVCLQTEAEKFSLML